MKATNELIVIDRHRKACEAEQNRMLAARLKTLRSTEEWLAHFRTLSGFRKKSGISSDKSVYFI